MELKENDLAVRLAAVAWGIDRATVLQSWLPEEYGDEDSWEAFQIVAAEAERYAEERVAADRAATAARIETLEAELAALKSATGDEAVLFAQINGCIQVWGRGEEIEEVAERILQDLRPHLAAIRREARKEALEEAEGVCMGEAMICRCNDIDQAAIGTALSCAEKIRAMIDQGQP